MTGQVNLKRLACSARDIPAMDYLTQSIRNGEANSFQNYTIYQPLFSQLYQLLVLRDDFTEYRTPARYFFLIFGSEERF